MAMVCRLYNGGSTSSFFIQMEKSRRFHYTGSGRSELRCMQDERRENHLTETIEQEELSDSPKLSSSLSSLDSYFNKLQATSPPPPNATGVSTSSTPSTSSERRTIRTPQGLTALNAYFDRMQTPVKEKKEEAAQLPKETSTSTSTDEKVLSFLKDLENSFDKTLQQNQSQTNPTDLLRAGPRNASTFTSLFIGLNVAVFLFGLASPVQTPEMVEVPLPLLYGAKINVLIDDGQWWRLITPMFLHDGLIHIGLGAWALASFGPAVEYVYGSAGFCMLYFLGGIFGNLASFFHTPAPTVGGTGPLYALIAAWAVYVLQNRNSFGKEIQAGITGDMIQKLLVMSALHLALMDALPADNWTHVGATGAGALFGLMATPKAAELNVSLEDLENKMVMFGEAPDLQRLTVAFALCMAVYFCMYNLGAPAMNEALQVLSSPARDETMFI